MQVPGLDLPEPLLAYAIAPKTKGDEGKLATGLARLREEDPTLRVSRNEETHETVMHGMGEAHLEVMIERLKRKFGVEVTTAPAKIAFRETIRGKASAVGRHVKQTGGHGQYAVCTIEIEPLAHGEGFVYEDKIFGGAIPHQFIPSIEKGIVKTMAEGVLSGNPMVDLKVTLVDGKFHPVDSSDMAFQIAGSMALKEAVEEAGVALLEPIVDLEVTVPEAYTGDIMGDLNAKRGKIAGMEQLGGGKQRIRAQVPQAEVARYVIDLRSMTGGRGAYTATFAHYEEMPQHLAQKVIDEYQAARAEARSRRASARRGARSRKGSTASSNASGARRFTTWSASIDTSRPSSTSCEIRCDARRMSGGSCVASTTSVGTSISPSRAAAGGSSDAARDSSIVISWMLSRAICWMRAPAASSAPSGAQISSSRSCARSSSPRLDRGVDRRRQRAPTTPPPRRSPRTRRGRPRSARAPTRARARSSVASIARPPPIEQPTRAVRSMPSVIEEHERGRATCE